MCVLCACVSVHACTYDTHTHVHTRVYVLMYVEVARGVNEDECVCLGLALQPLSTEQVDRYR